MAERAARAAGKTGTRAAAKVAETAAANGEVVESAVEGSEAIKGLNSLSDKSGNIGLGFLGITGSLWCAAFAYSQFRKAMGKPTIPVPPPQ